MLLSKHPQVVQKLRDEHTAVFSPDFETTVAQLQEKPYKLNELTYTTAVIRETLRLFPVGFGPKQAAPGATITAAREGRIYPIDRGLCIIPLQHHMHYSPSYFEHPTVFKPERFLDGEIMARGTMRAFSRGPRGCAGQELAVDELRIILLVTVRDFDFEYVHMEPNEEARAKYTELDKTFGDVVFQELGMEAKPRGGMTMKVREVRK
jgi:cytochrome P450